MSERERPSFAESLEAFKGRTRFHTNNVIGGLLDLAYLSGWEACAEQMRQTISESQIPELKATETE